MEEHLKAVVWVGTSHRDLQRLSAEVRGGVGFALYRAQQGAKHRTAKVLKGFGGAGVLEVVEDDDHGTYRAVYTVRYAKVVYVLHVFQKKSTRGVKTPAVEMELVRRRLMEAAEHYQEHQNEF